MMIKLDTKNKPQYTFIFWKGEEREEKHPSKPNICVVVHMHLTTRKTISRCFHCYYEMRCLTSYDLSRVAYQLLHTPTIFTFKITHTHTHTKLFLSQLDNN